MITIFYNKTTLQDTLIINVSDNVTIKNEHQGNFVWGKDQNGGITFINVFHLSNYINLVEGYLYLDDSINELIKQKLNVDLQKYNSGSPFVVGEVVECNLINNTHLHICKLNIGEETLSIVCGADNVRQGILVVVARIGAVMPNGLLIKHNKLMNHDSYGMICSARELNLRKHQFNSQGIIELPNYFKVGQNFMHVYTNFPYEK